MSLIEKIYINARAFFSILSIKKSEHNFVLSNYAKNEKNILFGIDSNVLCGALNESTFDYEPKKDFSEYSCYKHKLLSIARLDENKRLDELLAAFSDFIKIEPESILLIGGRGPELENLQKQTQDLGIEKNVDFLGFIPEEELFDWYSMADLFVSIDWADYRITMYEALVMNTKVVLSDETDADPFLCDSKYLYTTKPDKLSTLPTLSLALKEKPTISKSELKKYLKKYTWLNYCKEISRILDKSNA
nr:glycosyltransferase [Vibrio coralliilyticus]